MKKPWANRTTRIGGQLIFIVTGYPVDNETMMYSGPHFAENATTQYLCVFSEKEGYRFISFNLG